MDKDKKTIPVGLPDFMRPEAIGDRLRTLRLALGYKPMEMADALGVPRPYWSRFENGHRPITNDVAWLLISKYGVTLDYLILGRWDSLPHSLVEKLRAVEAQNRASKD